MRRIIIPLCLGVLVLLAYFQLRQPTTIPVIHADLTPYKRMLNTVETKQNMLTESTVHAVIGGKGGEDPSMQNIPPTVATPPVPETDTPNGMTIPTVAP